MGTVQYIPDFSQVQNKCINGGLDWWQAIEATGTTISWVSVSTYLYGPDQWYARNTLGGTGTAGILTLTQVAGVTNQSLYGCKLQITTAPITAPTNGCFLTYIFDNFQSQDFYNQNASAQILIKALGNVTSVTLQFKYATSETKLATGIGSAVVVTINSSSFSIGQIIAQAMGTAQGTGGVVGLEIGINAVSSGNVYDLNNGFMVEQCGIYVGNNIPTSWARAASPPQELGMLLRYFWKTFPIGTKPAQSTGSALGAISIVTQVLSVAEGVWVDFPVPMRAAPAITFYGPATGDSKWSDTGASSTANIGQAGFLAIKAAVATAAGTTVQVHAIADARM